VTVSITDHIDAVVDHLNVAGLPAGRGVQPETTGWQGAPGQSEFVPYGVVWRIGSNDARDLSLDDRTSVEARLLVFIRVFGGTATQAEQFLDAVHDQMVHGLTVPGRSVVRVWLENGQTTTKSDATEVSLFEAGNFYRLWTVPDPEQDGS
jgi:hypothetical protein